MSKKKSLKKKIGFSILGMLGISMMLVVSSCAVQLGLKRADTDLSGPPIAEPPVLGEMFGQSAVQTSDDWMVRRELLKASLSDQVYGPYPHGPKGRVIAHNVIDDEYADGAGRLEEYQIQVGESDLKFWVGLALPKNASETSPAPLIVAQSFCQNPAALHDERLTSPEQGGVCGGGGFMAWVIKGIFGKYIEGPPIEEVLERGYAYATIYSSEIAADNKDRALIAIEKLASEVEEPNAPVGVLSVWAAGFGWALDALDKDARLDASRTAGWGHSRQGKAVLWAAANDDRLEAVISHQSGTGGASLTKSDNGESVKEITKSYPHWFNSKFASYSGRESESPIDQHFLIALVAPRPVFLGNSWNDVWSDPNGAFRAAQGAHAAYEFLGKIGLAQTGMNDRNITAGELAFQISKGRHGIREQDWDDFLTFLDHWFKPTAN